jgi:type IV pilus assembly protein PilF
MWRQAIAIIITIIFSQSLISCSSINSHSYPKNHQAAEYNARLGAEYLKQNQLKLAHEKLSKALQQNPKSEHVNHYYALLQERLGDPVLAKKHFQLALNISQKNPELHNNYGSFLCIMGDYSQALSQFLLAIKDPLYKTPEFAYTNAGVCLKKSGNIKRSETYFRKALQIKPQFSLALYQMALLNWNKGNMPKAQAFLYRYNDIAKQTPKSLLLCKKIHDEIGEIAVAEQCVSQLLSYFPTSKEASQLSQ